MKGKMKGFGLYLIILVCLLAGVSYVVSQTQQTETLSYNQIYNYFMDGDVDQYDVDDTTLTMQLKKENQTSVSSSCTIRYRMRTPSVTFRQSLSRAR